MLAYIANPSLTAVLQQVTTEPLPREFIRLLQNSELIAFAGYTSIFGLFFFLLYLLFPVFYVWYHINATLRIISEMPLSSNPIKRMDKKTFLSELKSLGFIGKLAKDYGSYLVQGAEEEVPSEVLKTVRLTRAKNKKIKISPVSATISAETVFNEASLVRENLMLGFFSVLARAMAGAAVVCLVISILSFSLVQGKGDVVEFHILQTGMMAFVYLLISAVIIGGLAALMNMILSQNADAVARKVNGLFYQNSWQQDIARITSNLEGNSAAEKLEKILQDSLNKPMKEISGAVKALALEQEKKLDHILSKTLDNFSENLMKKSGSDMGYLNRAIKDAALSAEQMKKHFVEANSAFSKQMDKQSTAIAKHLTDMQKILGNSEKITQAGSEKIIVTLAGEVENTYKKFGEYMESSLKRLDEKQTIIESSSNDKNGIMKDLHDTAKDMATISNASGMLLERFIALATELDQLLSNMKENGLPNQNDTTEKRDKLKLAMLKLKKINKDRIDELPDM
ncbi:MAG: hypothetical protein JKY45_14780 [Emcibacter sp.]|nr:hypothetical protein [Emcibacter sp.]